MESSMLSGENKELEGDVVVFKEFRREEMFEAMEKMLSSNLVSVEIVGNNIVVEDYAGGEEWMFIFNDDGWLVSMTGALA